MAQRTQSPWWAVAAALVLCGVTAGLTVRAAADDPPPLGFKPMPPEMLARMPAPVFQVPTDMPTSRDWTAQTTIAKNQSSCGGCWAFAAVGLVEAMAIIQCGASNSLDLAEQLLLSCDVETHPIYMVANDGCCGGYVTVFDYLSDHRLPTEAQLAFAGDYDGDNLRPGCTSGNPPWSTVPCPDPLPEGAAYRVDAWGMIRNNGTLPSANELKGRLQVGPVWLGFDVYEDFYTYWNSADPEEIYTHTSGSLLGGHAVLLVGYDDDISAWIVRNSWGATGGPRGDGTWLMSYTPACEFGLDAAWATVVAEAVEEAACCDEIGACAVMSEADCTAAGGSWHADWEGCDPNPCPTPATEARWGQIKGAFR